MSRQFLIMRHAKSDWSSPGRSDHERPLNKRGIATAPQMAAWLEKNEFLPDFIWCSTATRAKETLELMLPRWEVPPIVAIDELLYHATADRFMEFIRRTPRSIQKAMLIGHNPGLEELINELAPGSGALPTAACALFELDEGIEFAGIDRENVFQVALWRPREVLGQDLIA